MIVFKTDLILGCKNRNQEIKTIIVQNSSHEALPQCRCDRVWQGSCFLSKWHVEALGQLFLYLLP